MKRRYFWWGVYSAVALLSSLAIVIVAPIAFAYDGECGGLMPFLAGPRPCSFWEYFSGWLLVVVLSLWDTYWPLVLALFLVPTSVGYLLDVHVHNRVV